MIRLRASRLTTTVLTLGIAAAIGVMPAGAQAPSLAGVWRSDDTTIRIAIDKSEAKATFVEVGQGARSLGFKPGESSFTATVNGNYLHGEQTIRYGGTCHPNGRKVPVIGRLTPNGQTLALHFYNVNLDPSCRDTGEYTVTESLWQRAAAR